MIRAHNGFLVACVLALVPPGSAHSSECPALDVAAFDSYIASCVAAYRIPGLSFALVEDGELVFAKGYGAASRGRIATADTPYYLGSTSKMFTALAVLRLAEEGRVDLDAPYKRYVPEFNLAARDEADKITIRHLLNHTSGLSDRGSSGDSVGCASLEAELARMRGVALDFEPGKRYRYYNVNYRLLALLVERVSGSRFGAFVEKEVFAPMGMAASLADDPEAREPREPLAQGHGSFLALPLERRQEFRAGTVASGMMVSTARDIGAFFEAALAVDAGGAPVGPLSADSLVAVWTAPPGVEGYEAGTSYGMGWMVVDNGQGDHFLFHGGSLENFQTAFYLDPERRRGFAILANQGGIAAQSGFAIMRGGLFSLLDGKAPGPVPRRPAVAILAAILVLAVAFTAFRLLRLRAWRTKVARRSAERGGLRPVDWIAPVAELGVVLFAVFGFLPLGNAITGDRVDWGLLSGLAPDAVSAMALTAAGALAVAFAKAVALLGLVRRSSSDA